MMVIASIDRTIVVHAVPQHPQFHAQSTLHNASQTLVRGLDYMDASSYPVAAMSWIVCWGVASHWAPSPSSRRTV